MDNVQLYKKISLEIVSAINNDEVDLVGELLDKRQYILDNEINKESLIEALKDIGIMEIDKNIQELLVKSISNVKVEIKKHKKSVQVNNSYTNSFSENLNIFYKKV